MRLSPARAAVAACLIAMLAVGVAVAQEALFHGNAKSYIFHRQGCRFYACAACTAPFATREAAVAAGYHPCKVCKP